MPEIGEVARVVSFLGKHLVGRRIASIQVQDDAIVYGKVGTTAAAFAAALNGKTVLGARQQGKYFWLEMSSPPHPLMHLGMTGWIKFSNEETFYYKAKNEEMDKIAEKGAAEWPPRFWKFIMKMEGKPDCQAAFVDARRLARIRLVDVPAEEMRNTTPLKENGPDPVIDKEVLTLEWLTEKLRKKKVPVKAWMLDQANISGVGNWVADEVLYNARIHPEQYSNTLNDAQYKQLHNSLMYVCDLACSTLADSEQFPADWLFKYRWGKGKKDQNVLPNGEKIIHLKVGGRTSAIVPTVQKKTGPVAADVDEGDEANTTGTRKAKSNAKSISRRKKVASSGEDSGEEAEDSDTDVSGDMDAPVIEVKAKTKTRTATPKQLAPKKATSRKRKEAAASEEEFTEGEADVKTGTKESPASKRPKKEVVNQENTIHERRRRSDRIKKA